MDTDTLLWSRLAFALPIVFPALTIGLASYLAVLEGLWLGTREAAFRNLYRAWARILAAAFGMSLVLGLLSGSWNLGRPATLGGLLAFAVEAGLLAVMLGWRKAGPRLHVAATLLVALGALVLGFWTLMADVGSHSPAASPGDPASSFLAHAFVRFLLGAYLWTALLVGAASAWRLLRDSEEAESCLALKMAIGMFVIAAPLQLVAGDVSDRWAVSLRPTSLGSLQSLSLTAGLGLLAIALGVWGAFLAWRGALERARAFLWICVLTGPTGLLVGLAGWAAAGARSLGSAFA